MSRLPGDGDINMFIIDWTSFGKWAKHVLSSNLKMTRDAEEIVYCIYPYRSLGVYFL